MNIAIVLGYGVFIPPQPEYQNYLKSALKICQEHQSDLIITCGGCSNKNHPTLSESESIGRFFLQLDPNLESHLYFENRSLSTPENLQFSRDYLASKNLTPEKIFITCDSIRVPKVFMLALQYFSSIYNFNLSEADRFQILGDIYTTQSPDLIRNVIYSYQHISIMGIPLSQTAQLASGQIVSSMLEMHAPDYPDLHQQFLAWRKHQWGIDK